MRKEPGVEETDEVVEGLETSEAVTQKALISSELRSSLPCLSGDKRGIRRLWRRRGCLIQYTISMSF
jgi:hypothetical protein